MKIWGVTILSLLNNFVLEILSELFIRYKEMDQVFKLLEILSNTTNFKNEINIFLNMVMLEEEINMIEVSKDDPTF